MRARPISLASCYRRSLEEADRLGVRSIAFPAISTGVYGTPQPTRRRIAVATVRSATTQQPVSVDLVRFVCFDAATAAIYDDLVSVADG